MATALVAPSVRAQATSSQSIAEALFVEGKALMQAHEYARACEKLKASHDLDRTATGTLLNLALCHELVDKPATAWAEFRQVAAESAGRRDDRVKLAREHEAKLFPLLSRIRITVPPATHVTGLALRLDDEQQPIAEASWGVELPIDPGKHHLEASAPGKLPRAVDFVVGAVSEHQTVAVEPLDDAPVDAADPRERDRLAAARSRRVIGFALGGVGLVAAGVGVAFGVAAANNNRGFGQQCPNDACPTQQVHDDAVSSLSTAKTFATLSNITVGAGALLLVTGVVLVVASPGTKSGVSATPPAARLRFLPAPTANGGGLFLTGDL
ncbi:MAG: hypothetical protein JWO86_2613 [Myxococcaceae bacterium]|jgi:hypothetical protein|nr:hypothetical protein [Myxococcaceae bacterium]MEA2751340.1 hypothetical protein [Myxococcales bacterium]